MNKLKLKEKEAEEEKLRKMAQEARNNRNREIPNSKIMSENRRW